MGDENKRDVGTAATCQQRGSECALPMLSRTAKAIHTLFFGTMEAGERWKALRGQLATDEELAAYQALNGVGLINFDPLPPEILAGLQTKVAEMERDEAERKAKPPNSRIEIEVNGTPEGAYFKRLLTLMYERWEGTLDYEAGRHRLVWYSAFDERCRRHSDFAHVSIDGYCPDLYVRSYVLGPYLLVKDERTGRESSDPWTVLGGDLTAILPEADDARA